LEVIKNEGFKNYKIIIANSSAPQGFEEITKADLTSLIGPNSTIRHLKICNFALDASKEFWELLETNTSLSILETNVDPPTKVWIEFLVLARVNPFIEVIWPQRRTNFDYFRFSINCKGLLKSLLDCVLVLQTILLSKDRGLFANIPNEVMFNIFRQFTQHNFNPTQLATLFDIASKHEWIFENANTREKLRQLWKEIKPSL
jgi:hypothetical protein